MEIVYEMIVGGITLTYYDGCLINVEVDDADPVTWEALRHSIPFFESDVDQQLYIIQN